MARDSKDGESVSRSAADLLDETLREQAQAFAQHIRTLSDDYVPERLHKARVALRRLRSALQGFAPILDAAEARRLSRQARTLFRILGPLREADVAVASFASEDDADQLRARAETLRAETRDKANAAGADRFAGQVETTLGKGRLLARDPAVQRLAQADAAVLGALALQQAWTRVLVYGDSISALQEETRHDFRKDMKTLRYLTEFFVPEMPGRKPGKFIRRMEDLQADLGELNDIAVHAGDAPLDDALQRRADRAMKAAESHWAKLRTQGPWWS